MIYGRPIRFRDDQADGDYAYVDIQVIDKDSIEHLYLTYKFQFSSRTTE